MKDFVEHLGEGALSLGHIVSTITSISATNSLETTLIDILMNRKQKDKAKLKLELMFDGFDEIVFEKRINAMLTLHIILTEVPSARVWVTMRDHMLHEIRIEFGTLGFKLEPFSKQIQINYLLAYWNKKFHSSNSTTLLREVTTVAHHLVSLPLSEMDREFAGSPLICRILAEVYERLLEESMSSGIMFGVENHPSLTNIYSLLIERKFQVYIRDKKALATNSKEISANDFISVSVQNILRYCNTYFAIRLIFSETVADEFESSLLATTPTDNRQLLYAAVLDHGIVQKLSPLTFSHMTFAEFIVAQFICHIIRDKCSFMKPNESTFQKFLKNQVLATIKVNNIWEFEFPSLCHFLKTLLEGVVPSVPMPSGQEMDLPCFKMLLRASDYSCQHVETDSRLEATNALGHNRIKALILGYPTQATYNFFVSALLNQEYEICMHLITDEYYRDQFGPKNWKVLQSEDVNQFSILHWAIVNMSHDNSEWKAFIKYIVDQYKSIGVSSPLERKDIFGRTPLLLLIQISMSEKEIGNVLHFLIDELGADIYVMDNHGNSIFHMPVLVNWSSIYQSYAALVASSQISGYIEILRYLGVNGRSIDLLSLQNYKGETPFKRVLSNIKQFKEYASGEHLSDLFDEIEEFNLK